MQRSLYKRVVGSGYFISKNERSRMKRRTIENEFFNRAEEHANDPYCRRRASRGMDEE